MFGQAVHVRGFNEMESPETDFLLRPQRAETYYSKAIELANTYGNIHIEAAAYLNRGIVRRPLGRQSGRG